MSRWPILTRRKLLQAAAIALGPTAFGRAAAVAYPEQTVKIVHAWPGAPVDTAMRYLADKLQLVWKQSVLIDTRPGGSEVIAGNAVAMAAPDGYTLFAGADNNFSTNKYLLSKMPFDPSGIWFPSPNCSRHRSASSCQAISLHARFGNSSSSRRRATTSTPRAASAVRTIC